jgi:hypothetical protein
VHEIWLSMRQMMSIIKMSARHIPILWLSIDPHLLLLLIVGTLPELLVGL